MTKEIVMSEEMGKSKEPGPKTCVLTKLVSFEGQLMTTIGRSP